MIDPESYAGHPAVAQDLTKICEITPRFQAWLRRLLTADAAGK
jgi:hypothetical protein